MSDKTEILDPEIHSAIVRCGDCLYWEQIPATQTEGKVQGKCRLDPPKTHVLSYPVQAIQGAQMAVQVISAQPDCVPQDGCAEGQYKDVTVEH
jgi:hypothetical protein